MIILPVHVHDAPHSHFRVETSKNHSNFEMPSGLISGVQAARVTMNSKEWEADLLKNALLHFPFLLSRFWLLRRPS